MTSANAKLFDWQRLRTQRDRAAAQLRALSGSPSDEASLRAAQVEFERLDRAAGAALAALDELRARHAVDERVLGD